MEKLFNVGTSVFRLKWDDDGLNDIIGNLFTPWTVSGRTIDRQVVIEKKSEGYSIFNSGEITYCPDEPILVGEIERTITSLSQTALDNYNQLHAACIGYNGSGVLIVGTHGIGKTTLALTALHKGFEALTDDIAVLDHEQRSVRGFPRPFRLKTSNADKSKFLPDNIPTYNLYDGFTYVFFYLPDHRYYSENVPVKHIIFPKREEGPTRLRSIGETEAVGRILKEGINFNRKTDGCISDVITLIRNAPPFELTYSDRWDAVSNIRQLLQ